MLERILGLFVRDGRLRSGWRVALYLSCYLFGLLIVQTPIVGLYVIYLMSRGLATMSALLAALAPDQAPMWFYLAVKLAELALLLALTYVWSRFLDRRRFVDLGFHMERGWAGDLLVGLALGAVQMGLIFAVEWAGGWLSVGVPDRATLMEGLVDGAMAIGLFVFVALGEELMFRGYVQTNLREGIGLPLALVLTSALFGVAHALNPNVTWMALVNIALAGLALGYGFVVTGELWLPMAYHFGWNFFQGPILGLAVSGVRYGGLLAVADRGTAPLITGAAFGPEAGLVGTVVLLAAFPVFWWWGRRRGAG